jgi:hypothetical protein
VFKGRQLKKADPVPAKPLTTSQLIEAVEAVARFKARGFKTDLAHGDPGQERGAIPAAAEEIGIAAPTLWHRLREAERRLGLTTENIGDLAPINSHEDRPDPLSVLDRHTRANLEYIAKRRLKPAMFMVRPEPFAVAFMGDPHLSNAGCNLDALQRDCGLLRQTGTRAIQMGDILDNFHANPKMAAKEAHNRMSISEALSVAQWLIAESGVKWDAHVLGNHDLWIGPEGVELLKEWVRRAKSRMFDWNARLIYRWGDGANDQHVIAASHDFKGSSIYNPLHGNVRMAQDDGTADTYVAAHRHNHADAKVPNGWRQKTYQLVRVRGYKDWDSYSAGRAQFADFHGMEGRSALLVVNPLAQSHDGRQRAFMDVAEGLEYLAMLKARAA